MVFCFVVPVEKRPKESILTPAFKAGINGMPVTVAGGHICPTYSCSENIKGCAQKLIMANLRWMPGRL